jgi:hypothetical protein
MDLRAAAAAQAVNNSPNIIRMRWKFRDENAVNSIARKRPTKTLCSLLAIESHFWEAGVRGGSAAIH